MPITINGFQVKAFTFPGGERQVSVLRQIWDGPETITINFDFRSSADIIDLLLVVDALRNQYDIPLKLNIPYVPFGRQDRVANKGEAHSLKVFANLINGCGFEYVKIVDPHSDVTEALFDNVKIVKQEEIVWLTVPASQKDWVLVAPDGGALKKIFACAKEYSRFMDEPIQVIRADKVRDTTTGEITGTYIANPIDCTGKHILIVDDICDGGRTFTELAKTIRGTEFVSQAESINLYVTHGIFSKGLEALEGYIDNVYCYNIMNDAEKPKFINGKATLKGVVK